MNTNQLLNRKDVLDMSDIRKLYPNEWILLGNPKLASNKLEILAGIPIFHSKDKKEVCLAGRDKVSYFDKITLILTGSLKQERTLTGIFNRIK